jgi:hypothetical protein
MTDTKDAAFEAQRREQIRAWLEQAKKFAAKALAAASERNAPTR